MNWLTPSPNTDQQQPYTASITLAMNHEKPIKSLMKKNVKERLTALEQATSTPGKTTICS